MADDELMDILEESDAESELTESGEEHGEGSEEEEGENQKPLEVQGGDWLSSALDPSDQQLDGFGFGGGAGSGEESNAMLLKQEIFDQADPGWLDQRHPSTHIQVKEEEPARRRSRGN